MQVDILMLLQKFSNPILDKFFIQITNLGSETFLIFAITIIFWCLDKRLGIKLFLITVITVQLNMFLKGIFKAPRPNGHSGIKSLYIESAPGYSFPSGHSQISVTFWYYLERKVKDKRFSVLAFTLIILIGFSRLYLRVHWPVDVITGLLIGLVTALLLDILIEKLIKTKLKFIISIIFTIIIANILLLYMHSSDSVKLTGILTGSLIGFLAELKYINFNEKVSLHKQLIKFIIGISILFVIKSGLKFLFPHGLLFEYIRYFIMGIWITFIAPFLYVKLNLDE